MPEGALHDWCPRQRRYVVRPTRREWELILALAVPGTDSGNGFTLKMIEDDPSNFFTDVHTANAVPGAIRGQLSAKKQK